MQAPAPPQLPVPPAAGRLCNVPREHCMAGRSCGPEVSLATLAGVAAGATLCSSSALRLRRGQRTQLFALSMLQRLFAKEKSKAERLDEEIVEMRRQEEEDLQALHKELGSQAPSEQDLRVEALRRQQEKLARFVALRRSRRTSSRRTASEQGRPDERQRPKSPPAPWRSYLDVDTGCWYYHNEETNVTTWDLPTALMRERPPEPLAPWQLVPHAPSGRWYYHNRRTGETTWDRPRVSSCRGRPGRRVAPKRHAVRSPQRRSQVRFVAMTEQPEVSNVNRDRQFEIVRDGEYAEAKKVLSTADMSWRHSALDQNFLFFIAARRRRGSELLAKQCVAMGVDLEEEDVHGQTPLFYAAARGNMAVVKFLLNLGFEINYRDNARKTALFFAIEKGHLEVADYLIERAASVWVRSSNKVTPHSLLKKLGRKPPERKRKLASPTPSCICPGAAARSRFAQWEWKYDEDEPEIDRREDNVVVETPQYFVCSTVTECAKRLRRSELEFAGDHAHLHQDATWYPEVTTQQAAALVNVRMDDENEHLKVIEGFASGCRPSAFTLPAVSTQSKTVAGYVHASFADKTLTITQCKVDRPHQGRGLGGLLLEAAEKRARNLGASISRVKLSVLQTNEPAQTCYAKAGFKVCAKSASTFPPCNCRNADVCAVRVSCGSPEAARGEEPSGGRRQVACCIFSWPMSPLTWSSSQDARAQNWPGIHQEVRFVAMTEQAEVSNVNRDRQFEIVRDGEYAEAKNVLSTADMTWRHSALRQNFLFFIAARRRRGSELLAKQCVAMGVDLEEEDVHGQTPLFYAAARGNMAVVKFLLNLGFEINYRDNARKTALFFAIEKGHLEVADYLIERAASVRVRSSNKVTPHSLLKKLGRKPPERKRKLASPTPSCICPGAAARSRFAQWEWKYDEAEPEIDRREDNVLVETPQYFVCSTVTECAKRLRRSELEFAGDHAHLHQDATWYPEVTTQQAAALVNVRMDDENEHLKVIEGFASGSRPSAFTLPAVSTQSKTVAGYVHASFADKTLTITQCKVDRPHQGRGLGGLLLEAAEKRARNLGASISRVKLSVLETNEPAQTCYAKAGFKVCAKSASTFPPCNCRNADVCQHYKIKWLRMEKIIA
ncbi:ANKRD65 [Symbiodinium microadriaticum]|nr:ANKRD65 [Symbiodinium microadriaticum]